MLNRKLITPFVVLILLVSGSCKKQVDNIKEDLMIKLITENTWKVVRYMDGTTNTTAEFVNYDFKFSKNNTVDAIRNGVTEGTGTWLGSESTQSITSEFPTAGAPLNKLNGVWLITNTKSKPWRVFSHRFENGKELILDLQEK